MTDEATLTDAQREQVRRFCGYDGAPPANTSWRMFQTAGLLEFRLRNLTAVEVAVVSRYLSVLNHAAEIEWRNRLCAFLGIPQGPALVVDGAPDRLPKNGQLPEFKTDK